MANKTRPTDTSVAAFVAGIADEHKRADSEPLADLVRSGAAYTRAQDVAP